MFAEWTIASLIPIRPNPFHVFRRRANSAASTSRIDGVERLGRHPAAGQSNTGSTPAESAAAATNTLNVDPGG